MDPGLPQALATWFGAATPGSLESTAEHHHAHHLSSRGGDPIRAPDVRSRADGIGGSMPGSRSGSEARKSYPWPWPRSPNYVLWTLASDADHAPGVDVLVSSVLEDGPEP